MVEHTVTAEQLAKQQERRNKPSKLAHDFTQSITAVGHVQSRHDLFMAHLQSTFAQCNAEKQTGQPATFFVDTITCPLYQFDPSKPPGDFTAITTVGTSVADNPRYRDKFERYLLTMKHAAQFLKSREITPVGRIYFGDAGVINADKLKAQFGVTEDAELRAALSSNARSYEEYLMQTMSDFDLDGIEFHFANLTDIAPELLSLPMDLHASVDALDLMPTHVSNISVKDRLTSKGINEQNARAAVDEVLELTAKRTGTGNTDPHTYREVLGFMVGYGLAGKAIASHAHPGLFVSLDTPGNYRNDLYSSYFSMKGEGLPVFTPNTISEEERNTIFANRYGTT